MKKILFDGMFLSVILSISVMALAATSTTGLVLFLKLDEGSGAIANNAVSNGSAGTIINGPIWTAGKLGQALSFDGVDDQLKVVDPNLSNMTTMTLLAWVNARSGGGGGAGIGRIISKDPLGARFFVGMGSDSSSIQFHSGYDTTSGTWKTPAGSFSLNSWHQVVTTYTYGDTSNVPFIYIDGVLQSLTVVDTPVGGAIADTDELYIGARGVNNRAVFDGLIDQVRIYNRILNKNEVSSIYTEDQPPISIASYLSPYGTPYASPYASPSLYPTPYAYPSPTGGENNYPIPYASPSTTTINYYDFGTITLRNGSRGEAVKELQRFLNQVLNLGLVIDGKLGPKTIAVIKTWQRDNGLVSDGLVGPKTKAQMNASIQ